MRPFLDNAMRGRHVFFSLLFFALLTGCQSIAVNTRDRIGDTKAIEHVVESFARALREKDKALYMSLFFSDKAEEIGWQYVSEDVRLAYIRQSKPDAIKARRIPSNNFIGLIDEAVATTETREEKFSNIHIDTDGEIASVSFDYEFYAAGKKTNWGKEMWQLVRTEAGWKIFSVVYTIRDEKSTNGA
jgi:hypothetical protein